MWFCKKLVASGNESKGWNVEYAIVEDLLNHQTYHINAKVCVLAAGITKITNSCCSSINTLCQLQVQL